LVLAALGLLIRNIYVIAISEFALLATATTLMVVLSGRMQDQLPSSQRSGVESAVSTFSTLIFVLSLIIFTLIARSHSVFVAAWLLVLTALLGALFMKSSLANTHPLKMVD
jgi:heme/copper-type cytochrome/quinol oxidase subunit 3